MPLAQRPLPQQQLRPSTLRLQQCLVGVAHGFDHTYTDRAHFIAEQYASIEQTVQ